MMNHKDPRWRFDIEEDHIDDNELEFKWYTSSPHKNEMDDEILDGLTEMD